MKFSIVALYSFSGLAVALPPSSLVPAVTMFRSSNVSNGETASSKAVGKRHTECQRRGDFGFEYILDKRDVAPEAGQPVVIGPFAIRFLAPTVWPEKA